MFLSAIKSFLRLVGRERVYAFVNLFGLSVGLTCSILLLMYAERELQFDRHFDNHQNIYRIVNELSLDGRGDPLALSSRALGPVLTRDFPEVFSTFTRFRSSEIGRSILFRNDDNALYWDQVMLTDTNVFDVFSHTVLAGDPELALTGPSSIAVSRSFAEAYFGVDDALGEIVSSESQSYRIDLIFDDLPSTTHLRYDVLMSMDSLRPMPLDDATLNRNLPDLSLYTYVVVHDEVEPSEIATALSLLVENRIEPLLGQLGVPNASIQFWAENLADIHLQSEVSLDQPTGNPVYVYSFIAIAILLLVMASTNYVNLATAISMKRRKEVSIRKLLGSGKVRLIVRFLCESMVFAFAALSISLVTASFVADTGVLDQLFGHSVSSDIFFEPTMLASMVLLGLVIGLASGAYPAFYLASTSPSTTVAIFNKANKFDLLGRIILLGQFTISITIIAAALLMASQLRYLSDQSMGFDKERKLLITLQGADVIEQYDSIRNELLTDTGVLNVTIADQIPGRITSYFGLDIEDEAGVLEPQNTTIMWVGRNFFETMNISVVEGRSFLSTLADDNNRAVIVNRAMVDYMGWQQAIGKEVRGVVDGFVVGVVDNFNFESLHRPITPLVISLSPQGYPELNAQERSIASDTIIIDISDGSLEETLEHIVNVISSFDPIHPVDPIFFDEQLDSLYVSEQRALTLVSLFSWICVAISALGLFGLMALVTERMTKEIGIRKVLGATSGEIHRLLLLPALKATAVAAIIASQLTYIAIQIWLDSFAFRVSISPLWFLIAIGAVAGVATITILLQSMRALQTNPAEALRYE